MRPGGRCDAEALQAAVDLDDTAEAGPVATRHGGLPGELRIRYAPLHGCEHGLRPAGKDVTRASGSADVTSTGSRTTSARGTRAAASAWCAERNPESQGRPERLREVRKGSDPDSAADEKRPRHGKVEAVAERPEHVKALPGRETTESPRAGPDRVDQEAELAGLGKAEGHGAREHVPRRMEHEELAREPLDGACGEPEKRVGADPLVSGDGEDGTGDAEGGTRPGTRHPGTRHPGDSDWVEVPISEVSQECAGTF